MKNMRWIWILLALLVVAGGGYYLYHKLSKKTAEDPVAVTQEEKSVFGSIKDAIANKLSLQCNFTSDDGKPTVVYMKMGRVRADMNTGKPDASSFLMEDKKIYIWQVASKTGNMMAVPDVSITPSAKQQDNENSSDQSQNFFASLEKFKNSCKTATVSDSLFVVPTNVRFTDFSQMMQKYKQNLPQQ